jgi:uncharacterized ferritin-like protein (DUF455 family)
VKGSLFDAALACLQAAEPEHKLGLSRAAGEAFRTGALELPADAAPPIPIAQPGRPPRPRLVEPRELPRRGLGSVPGRAAFIHAIAHIEFNAVDLAWDAVYRFRGMPAEFYADWVGVALDEARHFGLLQARLADLGHGYGDFDAHNGLWEMAERTAGSCLERMALVPRVLEARGLDVTPGMIRKLEQIGDHDTVQVLELILAEEVAHVAAGSRWFRYCCQREGVDAASTFRALLQAHAGPVLRGPFNHEARSEAGFTASELEMLAELDPSA